MLKRLLILVIFFSSCNEIINKKKTASANSLIENINNQVDQIVPSMNCFNANLEYLIANFSVKSVQIIDKRKIDSARISYKIFDKKIDDAVDTLLKMKEFGIRKQIVQSAIRYLSIYKSTYKVIVPTYLKAYSKGIITLSDSEMKIFKGGSRMMFDSITFAYQEDKYRKYLENKLLGIK